MFRQDPQPAAQRSGFKIDTKVIIIGLVLFVAAVFILPQLFGGDKEEDTTDTTTINQPNQPANPGDEQLNTDYTLGAIVAAAAVDRDNCPVNQTSSFAPTDQIYVVAQDANVTAGTSVFVRLYRDGELIEDAPEITADQDYENSCIAFVFEPTDTAGFDPGSYEALFVVNGNQAESVTFQVQ
ncbi:MAG TPA: hypothetical protein VHP83_13880 [Aggregatilineaceae bacterium]|nr:hypothetical protein [Aggregatilineaceae bacterium]